MPDSEQEEIETCQAKANIMVGRFTDAFVECAREVDHEPPHLTSQTTVATVDKKQQPATIRYTW